MSRDKELDLRRKLSALLLGLACLVGLLGSERPVVAQFTGSDNYFTPTSEPEATTGTGANQARESTESLRTYDDIYQMLLDRGVSEEAADRLLRDYPIDKSFRESEVDAILRRVRPEDLLTRRRKDERAPEAESDQLAARPKGGSLEPTPFGYDIFKNSPATFEPDQSLAAGSNYRLAPGDQLRVLLWGSVQQDYPIEVDREGNVALPEIGVIPAAGLPLDAFEGRLTVEMRRVFSNFKLSVSVRRLRRIQVVVAGDVQRPGAYLLSPASTTFNALYYAGGPTPRGTLRRVRVLRGGVLLAEVDLYRYLIEGDSSTDVRLLSGDTVFLPGKGGEVTVRGEVKRPAIFELLGSETVEDALNMAGGFTPTAFPGRATLERVSPIEGLESREIDLSRFAAGDSLHESDAPRLQDGDNLTIYSLYHVKPREFVEIQGVVQYPGIYPLYPGIRLADLVFQAGGLLDSAYPLRVEVSRLATLAADGAADVSHARSDSVSRAVFVDVRQALSDPNSADNIALMRDDKVYVRKLPGWKFQETTKLSGEVEFPGIYPLIEREERLSSVIRRSGGLRREAFLKGASLFRKDEGRVIINFRKALDDPGSREDIVLVDGDSLHVPAFPPTIQVEGEVSRPGSLLFEPGRNASYYIGRTGGPNDLADRGQTRIQRVDGVVQKAYRRFWWDPKVEPGSRIVVARQRPGKGVAWGSVIKDTTTILASLATTVFVVTQIKK